MGQAELRAVFKLINSPENKKVLDDNKQDIQRAISGLGATANKDMIKAAFGSASPSFIAKNPQLFAAAADAGKKSGEVYSRGFIQAASKFGGGKDLAKVLALPDINDIGKYKGATPPIIADVERERLKKMGLGIVTTMFNPWIGSRLLSDDVGGGAGGKGGGVAKGIFGAGGAFGFSEFYILITGIKKVLEFELDVAKAVVAEMKKAVEFAHNLYGKSLSSGLGLGFTAKRQMAADVLGVSETDVMRFKQATIVMGELSGAVNKIAKSAPDLAYLSAQFKILQYNILADASVLADKLTPAMDGFLLVMEAILKLIENSAGVLKFVATEISNEIFGKVITQALIKSGQLLTMLGKADMAVNGFGNPQSFMKQLGAGTFEKMGLVVAGGHANTTHDLIRKTNTLLAGISAKIGSAQGGVSRAFGLDPQTSNP